MFFQKVLKGINGLTRQHANDIINGGIKSNWIRAKKGLATSEEIKAELNEANLLHHLNEYNKILPSGHINASLGSTYGEVSCFISTSAGAIQRNVTNNIFFDPFLTALQFATKSFKSNGYLFYAYVITAGKKTIPHQHFSEDVRELHIYRDFMPYHHQGEVTAKIWIPSVNIQKAEYYIAANAQLDLQKGLIPAPDHTLVNPDYASPEQFSNVKELL